MSEPDKPVKSSGKKASTRRKRQDGSAQRPKASARPKRQHVSEQDPSKLSKTQFDRVMRMVRAHLDEEQPLRVAKLMETQAFKDFSLNRLKDLVHRVLRVEKQARANKAKNDTVKAIEGEGYMKAVEEQRERASLLEAKLQHTEAALMENERITKGMEIEIGQRREKEGKLNDQLELLRKDLGIQELEITNKEAEIQALESEIFQLRARGRDDPQGIDDIEHLQIDLKRSQEVLGHMQRIHVATASTHKDNEVEYKSCVDAMKRSDEAYRDLQARSALNKTIVAAFKRSARIEGLIRMVMEDLVQCRRHPDECIMKNMCHAIVGEFDVQTEHFGVEIRAAGPLDKLLTIWVKRGMRLPTRKKSSGASTTSDITRSWTCSRRRWTSCTVYLPARTFLLRLASCAMR
ncbi:hypothetical protein PINS_up017190 [Pythium insidiosum]|nr:hypothetical protein PINS_up017190 [Pythium insidiosum]